MPLFKEVKTEDIEHYLRRARGLADVVHVNKEFRVPHDPETPRRFVYKQIEGSEALEVVELIDELILTSSPAGRSQVRVTVFENDGGQLSFVIQQYKKKDPTPVSGMSISFYGDEFQELLTYLGKLRFIDFSNPGNFWIRQSDIDNPGAITSDDRELLDKLKSLEGSDRDAFLERLTNAQSFTDEDINVITGRRAGLNTFREQLYDNSDWDEPQWQTFFDENRWIFGYGLDYKFAGVLQKEAAVSNVETDGKSTVNTDFLMGSTDFTVLVEMKLPSTELFKGTSPQRSRTWGLSTKLMDAVSQILTQKAEWLVKSRGENFDENEQRIEQRAADPKAILIVGMRSSLEGSDREQQMKLYTFELFRRDSRNIEIITYDELYDRAFYIVNQRLPDAADHQPPSKDETETEPLKAEPAVHGFDETPF